MDWQLIAVIAIIAAAIVIPVVRLVARRRRGQSSGCSFGCTDCPISSSCKQKK
ncbi:MAG: FeoB-associated Cys-rich membrane protein [Muribaculaceae bacterium]